MEEKIDFTALKEGSVKIYIFFEIITIICIIMMISTNANAYAFALSSNLMSFYAVFVKAYAETKEIERPSFTSLSMLLLVLLLMVLIPIVAVIKAFYSYY